MKLRKIIQPLKLRNLLILRLTLATPLLYNLETGSISNLLINHIPYILLLFFFPYLLRLFEIKLNTLQIIWISLGLIIHPLGASYGLYYSYWFYDIIAHFHSSTIVSSILLAYLWRKDYSPRQIWIFSFLAITLLGTGWEVFERLVDDLTVYGFWDTIGDYIFNTLGWLFALKFGKEKLRNVWNR